MAVKIAGMMASTPKTTVATASSSISITSDKELAATITTQQPAPIRSDVIMPNTVIHNTANTSTLNITAAASRRGRRRPGGWLWRAHDGNSTGDAGYVAAGPQTVQPHLKGRRCLTASVA